MTVLKLEVLTIFKHLDVVIKLVDSDATLNVVAFA